VAWDFTYSRDPEALALNILGAAEIGIGDNTNARVHLKASISVDADNPLPYFNMVILERICGDFAAAEQWIAEAKGRGYSGGMSDKLIAFAQVRFANTDG
jgi:Flp pilus assembly protein TadD